MKILGNLPNLWTQVVQNRQKADLIGGEIGRKIGKMQDLIGGNLTQSGSNYARQQLSPVEIRSGGNFVGWKFGPAEI